MVGMKERSLAQAVEQIALADHKIAFISGPRQCGKTTFLETLPADWKRFDLERTSDHQIVAGDPELFLRLNPRHVAKAEIRREAACRGTGGRTAPAARHGNPGRTKRQYSCVW